MSETLETLANKIQAFLFLEGGVLSWKKLTQLIDAPEENLRLAANVLAQRLQESGLTILTSDRDVTLATSPQVEKAVRDTYMHLLQRDVGEAALEVLSIILYRGPSTRSEIDYIRGINTSSTIRTLIARGLIERQNPDGQVREYRYAPTLELVGYLGVSNPEELPEYAIIRRELAVFEDSKKPFQSHGRSNYEQLGDTEQT